MYFSVMSEIRTKKAEKFSVKTPVMTENFMNRSVITLSTQILKKKTKGNLDCGVIDHDVI